MTDKPQTQAHASPAQTLQRQVERMLRDTSLLTLGAVSRRAPYINVGERLYIVDGGIRTFSKTVTIDAATAITSLFQPTADILIHHFLAHCSDADGLNAFRFGITDQNEQLLGVDRDDPKDGTQLMPLGAHVLLSSADGMDQRSSLGLFVPRDAQRYMRFLNESGTLSYTVDITAFYQRVLPLR